MYSDKETDIRTFDLVVFDTELTGLDLTHEIIEIGYVKIKAGTYEKISEGEIKIKPERLGSANSESLMISGYNDTDWQGADDLKTGLQKFLAVTDGAMLVGHNVAIDLMFLKKSIEECGLQTNYFYKAFDTFNIAWAKLGGNKQLKKFSLSELAPYFGVDQGHAHRALDDAKTTYKIFLKLMEL